MIAGVVDAHRVATCRRRPRVNTIPSPSSSPQRGEEFVSLIIAPPKGYQGRGAFAASLVGSEAYLDIAAAGIV
jgi:hypothetical protein